MSKKQTCACHKQIIWSFAKPTIIVCEDCEKTFHYTAFKCDQCHGELTFFVKEGR